MAVKPDNYWLSTAINADAVTPNDSADLTDHAIKGLWVGGTGSIVLTTVAGDDVTIAAVPAGAIVPIQVARVKATGTTASSIVALY